MTPKEKAQELFYQVDSTYTPQGMVELICNEIIGLGFLTGGIDHERIDVSQKWYWEEVKKEVENLKI